MEKLRWGVIAAAGIADRRTIPGLLKARNAELVAVMDVTKEIAERIRMKYGTKRAYDNIDDLLADSEIDAVYIASPVYLHYEQVIKAAKAKKHILVEKPVTLSVNDSKNVKEICEENGVLAAAGLMMRYHSYHLKMKEIIEQGRLGQIVSVRAQFSCWYPKAEGAWRQIKNLGGGGAVADLGVHCVDIIQFITGSKVKRAAAFIDNKTFDYEVEDSASILMQMSNGANAGIDVNFNIPDAASVSFLAVFGTGGSMTACGTLAQEEGGTLEVLFADPSRGYNADQPMIDVRPVKVEAAFGNMYTKEIESFSDSVLAGKPVSVPLNEAIYVEKVLEAVYESAKTGMTVEINN